MNYFFRTICNNKLIGLVVAKGGEATGDRVLAPETCQETKITKITHGGFEFHKCAAI